LIPRQSTTATFQPPARTWVAAAVAALPVPMTTRIVFLRHGRTSRRNYCSAPVE
jgi:hypothetical protein